MQEFDGNEYRKRVMARLLADFALADPQEGDPFLVCDVDPDASRSAALIRLDTVVAFWQKERAHAKYKSIAGQLVSWREDYAHILTDPAQRAAAEARVRGARANAEDEAITKLDALVAPLVRRDGGIPRVKISVLTAVASAEGISPAAFARWLTQYSIVDRDDPDAAAPWESAVRQQMRKGLDELSRLNPGGAATYRSLFTLLGVGPRDGIPAMTAAHGRLVEANRTRARDRIMTITEDLLAHARTRLLVEGGGAACTASLRADAKDSVRKDLRNHAMLSGSLPAAELESFAARIAALGWGISAADARDLIRSVAHEVHLAVEVGGEIDLAVCPSCNRPQPVGKRRTCSFCRTDLYLACPVCSATVPAACDVCPACDAPLWVWRAAAIAVPAAQTALDGGLPGEAARLVGDALRGLDPASAPAPLRAVGAAAAEIAACARSVWVDLRRAGDKGALWAATASASWLLRNASDVPDPASPPPGYADPRSTRDWLAAFDIGKAEAIAATRAALTLPVDEREVAVGRLLRRWPDCPDAQAALAGLPLSPPGSLAVSLIGGVATVSWEPGPGAPRSVRYRVERLVVAPVGLADHTTVGTTSATRIGDAAAPAGTCVDYSVTAVDGARSSVAIRTGSPVFVDRDVEALQAEIDDGAVVLRWPAVGIGAAKVVLTRTVDPDSSVTMPTRQIHPHEPGRYVDSDVRTGIPFRYRIHLIYQRPDGTLVRTDGRSVSVMLVTPPHPVVEMWAITDATGSTTVSFASPPAGVVRLYACPGESDPLAGFESGSLAELERAASGAIVIGEGRRRVVDAISKGRLTYRAVTVIDGQAVAGASLSHTAVGKPSGLRVLSDDGRQVRVTFEFPARVTEAFVRWRRDRFPASPEEAADPAAGAGERKVTNMKLEIEGGVDISAPDDGRALFVAVYPAVRASGGDVVAMPVPAMLEARQAGRAEVRYEVEVRVGRRRQRLEIRVNERIGRPLPRLLLVASDHEPASFDDGRVLLEHPGGQASLSLRLEGDRVPSPGTVLRLFIGQGPGESARVAHPPIATRTV